MAIVPYYEVDVLSEGCHQRALLIELSKLIKTQRGKLQLTLLEPV
jgi:hypothetical protein